MKKILKIMLPGLALLWLASCSKNEGFDPMAKAPASLDLTEWCNVVKDSVAVTDDEGEVSNVDYTVTTTLLFQTKTVGVFKTEAVSKMAPSLNKATTTNFKYTYKRPEGVVYYDGRDELGHPIKVEAAFNIIGKYMHIEWNNIQAVFERTL